MKLRLQGKDGSVLAEAQTTPIRLEEGQVWSGVAEYEELVVLASESTHPVESVYVCLIDEDSAEFAEHDDETETHFGATTISLKSIVSGKQKDSS